MSTTELLHWYRYYQECPFGYLRDDYRQALNCAVFAAPYSTEDPDISSFLLMRENREPPPLDELVIKVQKMLGTYDRHRGAD